MLIDKLRQDMVQAWKSGDLARKTTLSNMINAIQKASVGSKSRVEMTEDLELEVLAKHQKMVQEQLDTCPDNEKYAQLRNAYMNELAVVKEYAPQMITDSSQIEAMIYNICQEHSLNIKSNAVMKTVMPVLKQKHCDMKVAQAVLKKLMTKGE